MDNVGRQGDMYQQPIVTVLMYTRFCVAMPQYAYPQKAMMTPVVPDNISAIICEMAFCFTFKLRNRQAEWAVPKLAMKKLKKEQRAKGVKADIL